jgi:BirA family biotin operon repressor/biotin-[acetyl-CoA-carboxylase] ligase
MLVPSSVALQCKWPNDLYANGGKLAGLLIQTIPMVEGGSPSFLVSLGLNGEKAPKTGDYPTASLASLGVQSLSPERLLEGWMEALEHGIADWQTYGNEWLRDRWMSVAWGCGHVITMQQGNQRISGKMRGITDEGALELQLADGTTCLMHSGHMIREDRLLPQPNDEGLL